MTWLRWQPMARRWLSRDHLAGKLSCRVKRPVSRPTSKRRTKMAQMNQTNHLLSLTSLLTYQPNQTSFSTTKQSSKSINLSIKARKNPPPKPHKSIPISKYQPLSSRNCTTSSTTAHPHSWKTSSRRSSPCSQKWSRASLERDLPVKWVLRAFPLL